MYHYRNDMGIGLIVGAAQRSLMMHAPPDIVEFRFRTFDSIHGNRI